MQPAPPGQHRDLHTVLVDYLARGGVTIAYAPLDGDGHWHADSKTLTLREDADTRAHLDILRDLIGLSTCDRSHLGVAPRRHLHLVPA